MVSLLAQIASMRPDQPTLPVMRKLYHHLDLFEMMKETAVFSPADIALVKWIVKTFWGGPHYLLV